MWCTVSTLQVGIGKIDEISSGYHTRISLSPLLSMASKKIVSKKPAPKAALAKKAPSKSEARRMAIMQQEEVKVLAPKTLNAALFAFQGLDLKIPRNGQGNINGRAYKYATLDDVMSITRKPLQDCGLMITQPMQGNELVTKLVLAETGEELVSTLELGKPSSSMDLGARITYLRRYQIVSMLGLTIEDDTDSKPTDVVADGGKSATIKDGVGPVAVTTTVAPSESISKTNDATMAAMDAAQTAPEAGLGDMPKHDSIVDPSQMTPQFVKAKNAIESCATVAALSLITNKISTSEKLNRVEKDELATLASNRAITIK